MRVANFTQIFCLVSHCPAAVVALASTPEATRRQSACESVWAVLCEPEALLIVALAP